MLSLLRKIPQGFDSVKKGNWDYEPLIAKTSKRIDDWYFWFWKTWKNIS